MAIQFYQLRKDLNIFVFAAFTLQFDQMSLAAFCLSKTPV
jgi:hypothetical protein